MLNELTEKLPGLLPDKLSERIRLAVNDAIACEQDPNYELVMVTWHTPGVHSADRNKDEDKGDGPRYVCAVCLAGAVLAKTLHAPRSVRYTPSMAADFQTQVQLFELDDVRDGTLSTSVATWYAPRIPSGHDINEAIRATMEVNKLIRSKYDVIDGHAPWAVYLQAADIFAGVGL